MRRARRHQRESSESAIDRCRTLFRQPAARPFAAGLEFLRHLGVAKLLRVKIDDAQHARRVSLRISPRSCKKRVANALNCSRSSATRFERRMWPASPQSITRCAMLIPAPATFARSFTSTTSLTGPLWMPMRKRSSGCSLTARADLQRALHRRFRAGEKDQRHAVAGGQAVAVFASPLAEIAPCRERFASAFQCSARSAR